MCGHNTWKVISEINALNNLDTCKTSPLQIEQRYKSEGLVIAGYYQANEHIRDNV